MNLIFEQNRQINQLTIYARVARALLPERQLIFFIFAEKNNVDIGTSISGELDSLKKNLDKYKKSGMGEEFDDVDIRTLDWVEDNRKVKAFFIYESSL